MSRADWKAHGRFNTDTETNMIFEGIHGWRHAYGDQLPYFRYNAGGTEYDDVYGEASGTGRAYDGPFNLPAIHVTHIRGANENGPVGFYYNDDLTATIAFDQYTQSGMILSDVDTGNYDKDRVVYDQKAFRITQISIRGQIQQRDTIVVINATELKPDELVDDAVMAQYTNYPTP